MNKKTLYKRDAKGGIRVWSIWTNGDIIFTRHGILNGETQVARKRAKGKSIGRANETTDEEQAELEALAMYTKKKDKGYQASNQLGTEIRVSPMLAHKWEVGKRYKWSYPVDVQPKFDGVRCMAYWRKNGRGGREITLMSRGGKPYTVPHIAEELAKTLPKNIILDGELYIHGIPFQSFMSLAKRNQPQSIRLRYCVYDCLRMQSLTDPWEERKARLNRIFAGRLSGVKYTVLVPSFTAFSDAGVLELQGVLVSKGYEGAILRIHKGEYRLGYRSQELLKVKSFDDDEFEIIGYEEGVGKAEGAVVWICKTESGKLFRVVPKGTYEQRQDWYENGDKYIGAKLTVKYFGRSEDNIPRFPIGIAVRDSTD